MPINKAYLSNLRATKDYRDMMNAVAENRPQVLTYDYNNDNTDEWKYKSAMQQGFDLCFRLLTNYEVQEK